jgi:hypothetical protein
VHDPLPQVRDWDVALGLPELPETLKFVALMTRSMFGEPQTSHFISTVSWLVLNKISTSWPHCKHLNSYMGMRIFS